MKGVKLHREQRIERGMVDGDKKKWNMNLSADFSQRYDVIYSIDEFNRQWICHI